MILPLFVQMRIECQVVPLDKPVQQVGDRMVEIVRKYLDHSRSEQSSFEVVLKVTVKKE